MQTVIVPVDFSETSLNAARYAVQLLTGQYGVSMILHHVYDKPSESEEAGKKLEQLNEELRKLGIVKTELIAEEGDDFLTELEKLARHRSADLVIMGITDRSALGQSLFGSNSLKMVEKKVCPVLIIPQESKYSEVKNVLLFSDFKDVLANTPSVPVKKILKPYQPHLHVLNVDSSHYVALTEEYQAEKAKLQQMFAEFKPEFYFMGLHDVNEAISQFAEDKKVDFIIVVHPEQSLFERLFVRSQTKMLAYQSSIPILALHE